MPGHFGFSYVGVVYLLMLTVPNLLWARNQPVGYAALAAGENRVLLFFERTGQVLTTTCAVIFRDFNLRPFDRWSWWLVFSFGLMLLYELAWVRYFRGGQTLELFYRRMGPVPVPLASLPVAGFFLLGVYGRNLFLPVAVTVLGVGHIGIHLQHRKTLGIK